MKIEEEDKKITIDLHIEYVIDTKIGRKKEPLHLQPIKLQFE